MRVLLTGGSGMVGRNLLPLLSAEHEVLSPRHGELDLTDAGATRSYVAAAAPDLVLHAAGRVGGIEANRRDNSGFLHDNVLMGLHLVRAAADAGVPRLLNLSSSCTYPTGHDEPLAEEDVLGGPLEPTNEGYAIAKIATERYCAFLRRERPGCDYKTAIPCNLYGPYDSFDEVGAHLVPSAIRKVHQALPTGGPVEIWGDGSARREFMYVGDLAEFVVAALQRWDTLPEVVNVGLGTDHSVRDYYQAAADVVGYHGGFAYDTSRPVGMRRKLLDCAKVHAWGWRARHSLQEGLRSTYDHYRSVA